MKAKSKDKTDGVRGKIVTANVLTDGAVVYLAAGGRWTETLTEARFLSDLSEQSRLLKIAECDVGQQIIVDPYLMDAVKGTNGPKPVSQRERIRAAGPTVPTQFDTSDPQGRTSHVPIRRV